MKWWFSDLDGTLVHHHDETIEPEDITFINKWIDNGNKFVITSGRMDHEAAYVLQKNGIHKSFVIANCGARVYDEAGKCLHKIVLDWDFREPMIKFLQAHKGTMGMGISNDNKRYDFDFSKDALFEQRILTNAPIHLTFDEGLDMIRISDDITILYLYIEPEQIEALRAELKALLPGATIFKTAPFILEVLARGVSKLSGIEYLKKAYNINENDIFATGDGENDLEMLAGIPNSFAMANGVESAKKVAKNEIVRVRELAHFIKD